jgi:SAM-dependent methyltransferase
MTGASGSHLGRVERCQACSAAPLETIMSFGHQPPVHSLLRPEQLRDPEAHYPLDLLSCAACGLVQLGYVVDPEILFPPTYPYQSGMTRILRENFRELTTGVVARLALGPQDLAIDIGSNDGTLLRGFRDAGVRVLGVEPTAIADIANANGIPTVKAFFGEEVADKIAGEHGPARVVTAANVFAHISNVQGVIRGIVRLLADGGYFVSESHYLPSLFDDVQYDTIYHEHLRYYSLRPLVAMLARFGLTVVDAEPIKTHGGSIRVFSVKGKGEPSERLRALLGAEDASGLARLVPFRAFQRRAVESKLKMMELIGGLRRQGARVVGVGAPARASMLANYCHLDTDLVEYVVEPKGSLKIGLYLPGSHLPVVDEERLFIEKPEYALMMSWHIGGEIIEKLRARGFGGKFIVPLPEPRVVG